MLRAQELVDGGHRGRQDRSQVPPGQAESERENGPRNLPSQTPLTPIRCSGNLRLLIHNKWTPGGVYLLSIIDIRW